MVAKLGFALRSESVRLLGVWLSQTPAFLCRMPSRVTDVAKGWLMAIARWSVRCARTLGS